jgi:hypothetical protein
MELLVRTKVQKILRAATSTQPLKYAGHREAGKKKYEATHRRSTEVQG